MGKWRSRLNAAVVLAIGTLIPATFGGSLLLWIGWIGVAVAIALLILFSDPVATRMPWRVTRKDPATDELLERAVSRYWLHHDLRIALMTIQKMTNPTPAELRAFASNLAERLRTDGYDMSAAHVEVHLTDDAAAEAVTQRLNEVRNLLTRMLVWETYS